MKVILVNGSPHKEGCTNRALQEIQTELTKQGVESEIFWIGSASFGCTVCASCKKTGKCVFDDSVNVLAEKAKTADGFVFGAPVYYANIAGGMAGFMDRLFFSAGKHMANKPAAGIVSCRREGATEAFSRLNKYFTFNNMPVVSSNYWNHVHGSKPSDVEKDLEGMQTMRTLAVNMAWLLKCIEAGKAQGIDCPTREEKVFTNFIRE